LLKQEKPSKRFRGREASGENVLKAVGRKRRAAKSQKAVGRMQIAAKNKKT
jgi:hypothetical protein